jgi:hypothetical protein
VGPSGQSFVALKETKERSSRNPAAKERMAGVKLNGRRPPQSFFDAFSATLNSNASFSFGGILTSYF